MLANVLVFRPQLRSTKNKEEGKNGRESNNSIKDELFKSLMMVRLNLTLDNVSICEETTIFVKERKINIKCKKKGVLNLAYKRGLLFQKSKECDKVKEMDNKNGVSKTHKSVRKVFNTQSGNEFKQFSWCKNILELF